MTAEELTQLAINTIRTLSIDAVQQAKSGRPGTPTALAAFAADPKGIAGRELLGGSADLQAAISANRINVVKTFGASAPLKERQRKFGFEPDQVVTVAKDLLSRSQRSHASVAA